MTRRRESLGRNRRGPKTRNTNGTLIFAAAVLLALAGGVAWYLTRPQRVYGVKTFECGVTEISWHPVERSGADPEVSFWAVAGCGKKHVVRCTATTCESVE